MHPESVIQEALQLAQSGMSDRAVARQLGVPRSSIGYWRRRPTPRPRPVSAWTAAGPAYAYVLGQYLGDGHITVTGGSSVLAVTVADTYPNVEAELSAALHALFPGARVRRHPRNRAACSVLAISHPALAGAFPQHGPGRKHERRIELAEWQRTLTHLFPHAFLRGLIHSDGSRCINGFETRLPSGRVARYEYVRYFFTNYSADIRRLFCEHCDLLGIRWTQSNSRNISIAHRRSVAALEAFVGPKS